MRNVAVTVAFVFLSGLGVGLDLEGVSAQHPPSASIAGRVLDKVTGEPIAKAAVRISSIQDPAQRAAQLSALLAASAAERAGTPLPPPPVVSTAIRVNHKLDTSADGAFAFSDLPPGDYQLTVTTDRYVAYEHGQRIVGGKGARLTLHAGERVEALTLPLTKKGSIAGTIVDQNGVGLADVSIFVYTQNPRPDRTPYFGAVGVVRFSGDVGETAPFVSKTDHLGRYRMDNLDPGEYYIAAHMYQPFPSSSTIADDLARILATFGGTRGEASSLIAAGFPVPVFYPNATDAGSARAVYVPPAGEIQGIDMALRPIDSATVKGAVTVSSDAGGQTTVAPGSRVGLFPTGPGNELRSGLRAITTTEADGTFQFSGVRPGAYKLIAVSGERRLIEVIDVEPGSAQTLTLTLQRGIDITGRVLLDTPLPATFRVGLVFDENYEGLNGFERFTNTAVNPDGSFVIRNIVSGARYGFAFSAGLGTAVGYLAAVRYGNEDLPGTRFVASADKTELVARFQSGAGRVDATTKDGDNPVEGILVLLAPKNRSLTGLYKSIESSGNGAATFYDVIPGDYDLFAFEGLKKDSWFDPRFMEKFGDRGQSIHVENGVTISESVPIINAEGGLN